MLKKNPNQWVYEFDFSNPANVKEAFKDAFEGARRNYLELFGTSGRVDIDRRRITRRMETALKNVEYARQMIGDDYPDYPGTSYFEMDWSFLNSIPQDSYDEIDRDHDLILAAAIWILDTLEQKCLLYGSEEDYLPELSEEEAEEIPSFLTGGDSVFSDEMLMKVVYVLIHRNDDCKVYTPKGEEKRNFLDEATVRDKNRQDVPSRNAFENLIAQLGEEAIEEAVNDFKE